ncbi:MAG: hypothetical protein IPP41_08655 [Rhodocyclaceae bacterium]|nr:hypothetical protein [Rhodocyclaceae bacterium]
MKYLTIRTPIALVVSICICACSSSGGSTPMVDAKPQRLQTAEAMFQERCKKSGEFIYRTAENVEGIFLLKVRPSEINYDDQFAMSDPYGLDSGGDTYIKIFFAMFYKTPTPLPQGWIPRLGYRYVDVIDPKDGKRYRYTGHIDEPWRYDSSYSKSYKRFVLDRETASGQPPRYGITYDDISTREEREYWIAGSSLQSNRYPYQRSHG